MERTSTKASSPKTASAFLRAQPQTVLTAVLFGGAIVPQFFRVGSLTIRYYSLILVAAILAAYFIGRSRAKRQGIESKNFEEVSFWIIIWGFIGARIYYVIFYFSQYRDNLSEIYKIWHGGLAIYGAIIGGLAALVYFCRKFKLDAWKFLDSVVFAMPVAQAIGRIGNFVNYEAFGKPTDLPWKMFVPTQFRPARYENFAYFHPTFLYEMIWSLLVFLILVLISRQGQKKNWPTGTLAAAYFILYGIGRFAIESIRLDSAYFFGIHGIRGDQITSLLLILAAFGIIVFRYASQNRK